MFYGALPLRYEGVFFAVAARGIRTCDLDIANMWLDN